ncbi:hypothetical protein KVR01_002445 [Diaporthe batatas]|uniref:uncharacterized protein n=1 Tax=Diaporthe batatas TaxID=748121 RepID=UPI001D05778B|nr:uncharacterized protein KVR01_002445 [Diaporthe batatas]KAG8166756.1 hypothetical protein KVR01_002445 [Diaporthe batatas]
MPDQWSPVDRCCAKRSNDECAGMFAKKQRTSTTQVDNTNAPIKLPRQGTQHIPAPPQSSPSATKQGGATTAEALQNFSTENEILDLFAILEQMVVLWVGECLPDVLPPDFITTKPEIYWELCGWTKPMSALGRNLLQNRSWAKHVYESWVWRFFYQEIFHIDSLVWAGFDVPITVGGLGGVGRATNRQFEFLKEGEQKITRDEYQKRIRSRAATMRRVQEEGAVTDSVQRAVSGWLVEEMLAAFYPYFADEYHPVDHPQNAEVLIRDTLLLVLKAQELDEKLRSARHVYEIVGGKEHYPVQISGVPSPTMQSYPVSRSVARVLGDDDDIALIVVPGLVKNIVLQSAGASPQLSKVVRRYAKAFTQMDLFDAIGRAS